MISVRQTWIVCEPDGRWTAAIRTAFARRQRGELGPRVVEVRTIDELNSQLDAKSPALALVVVCESNLTAVLRLLLGCERSRQLVAVALDPSLYRPVESATAGRNGSEDSGRELRDLLWEAGAAEVVESPRNVGGLTALYDRLSVIGKPASARGAASQRLVEWATSLLPWQES